MSQQLSEDTVSQTYASCRMQTVNISLNLSVYEDFPLPVSDSEWRELLGLEGSETVEVHSVSQRDNWEDLMWHSEPVFRWGFVLLKRSDAPLI